MKFENFTAVAIKWARPDENIEYLQIELPFVDVTLHDI